MGEPCLYTSVPVTPQMEANQSPVSFTFWTIGDSVSDLQNKLFTLFTFIFVAPGVMAQVQPLFIARRDIFEAREKKAKMYSWIAFTFGLVVSEFPYLVICSIL